MSNIKLIEVVGAVIVADGKILVTQRGPQKALSGCWEFPGGKIEAGETPKQALAREIWEELSCVIEGVRWFVCEAPNLRRHQQQ